jgi:hypothetical protein
VKQGAVLFGIAVVCLFLVGPIGPCGPSTPWGLIMLVAAGLSFILAWLVSLGSFLVKLRHRKSRSMLLIPLLVATPLAASFAVFMTRAGSVWRWTDAGWQLLCLWPPTVATVYAVQDRLLRAT